MPGVVRLAVSRQARFLRGDGHARTGNSRLGLIENVSGEASGRLTVDGRRDHKSEKEKNKNEAFITPRAGFSSMNTTGPFTVNSHFALGVSIGMAAADNVDERTDAREAGQQP